MLKANRVMTKRLVFMLLLVLCVLQAVTVGAADSGGKPGGQPFVLGTPPPIGSVTAHYTDNGNGTVTDKNTGLTWQKLENPATYNWYQASGTYDATYNLSSQSVCGSLSLAGGGWRLPTVTELLSLVDKSFFPAIDTTYFPNSYANFHWSSTSVAYITNSAWLVDFHGGSADHAPKKSNSFNVRCVRGGQSGSVCNLAISPSSQTFTSTGGTGSISVTASGSSCAWTASSTLSWVTITSVSSGIGSGTVTIFVSANTTTSSRTGTITIAGQTFTVTQDAAAVQNNCAATVSSSLVVHIPLVTYSGYNFWLDLQYNSGDSTLTLANYGLINDITPYSNCTASTLSSDFKLYIPGLLLGNSLYWLDLELGNSGFVITGGYIATDELVGGDGTMTPSEDDIQVIFGTGDQAVKSSRNLQARAQVSGADVPYLSQFFPDCPELTYSANCGPASLAMVKAFHASTSTSTKAIPNESDIKGFLDSYWETPDLDVLMAAVKKNFTKLYEITTNVDGPAYKDGKKIPLDDYLKARLDYFKYTDPNTKEVKINAKRLKYCGVHLNNYVGATIYQIAEQANFEAAPFYLDASNDNQAENILQIATEQGYPVIVTGPFFNTKKGKGCSSELTTSGSGHYLVVVKIDDEFVYVNDPACPGHKNTPYKKSKFIEVWGYPDKWKYKGDLTAPKDGKLPTGIVKQTLPKAPAKVGEPYTVKLGAVYGKHPTRIFKWTTPKTDLPPGLELTPEGVIQGVPLAEGDGKTYSFTVTATDGTYKADAQTSIKVDSGAATPPLKITTPPNLGKVTVGDTFDMPLAASGGNLPYTWIYDSLPQGINLIELPPK